MATPTGVVEGAPGRPGGDVAIQSPPALRRGASESVIRGAAMLLAVQPFTWLTSLTAAVLVPHYLGASGLGAYAVAVTLAGFIRALSGLGVSGLLARDVAVESGRAGVTTAAGLLLVLAASCTAALAAAAAMTLLGSPLAPPMVLRIALVSAVVSNGSAVLTAFLQGRERHGLYALCTSGTAIAGAWAGLAMLALGGGAPAYLAMGVASGTVAAVVMVRVAALHFTRAAFDRSLMWSLVVGGLPFMGWEVTRLVRAQIDLVLIAALLGTRAAGWLSAAYSIVMIPVFVPTLVATPLLPALSRSKGEWPEFRRTLRGSLVGVLALSLPASAGVCALAGEIPRFLHWPADLQHAAPLMVVLAWQQPLVAVDMVLGAALFALKRERRFLLVLIVAALFNPIANLIGVPFCMALTGSGVSAAPPIEVATEVIMLVGTVMLLPRDVFDRGLGLSIGRIALASAALYGVVDLVGSRSVPAAIVAGAATYALVALANGLVRPSEVREWCRVAQKFAQRRAMRFGN